ncbi:MAG: SpvB/TcaC N-terminal domain-containing protein, partial [Candidatus Falkowbacteria bacterium]
MLNKNFLKIFKKPAIFTLVFLFIFSFCGFLKAEDPDPQFGYEREPVSNKLRIQKDDLTGAFTYEYPLAIPPGRNGLQPNLSLNYNNQSADNSNLFGYGWSMNIPYIERINRTGVENMYEENNYYSSLSGELEKISTEAGGGGEKAGAGSPPEESEKDLYILQDLAKENPDGSVELYNPEEQVNKRTRNSKTYLTGWDKDNKKVYRGRFYTGEIHYYDKEKEEYKDIDTTLQDTLDGWNMNKASYSARIERSLADNFIKFTNQDQELRFSLINYPESTVNADKTIFDDQWSNKQAIYQDALGKDIDLTISLNNESLIKEAIINNLESLGDLTGKEYYEIQFKLTSNHNIDIKVDGKLLSKEGVITSKNKAEVIDDKNITSYIWPPKAEDSSDGLEKVINIEIEYKQTEDGIIMTKKLPVEWLK